MRRFFPLLTAVALLACGDAESDRAHLDESTLATVELELALETPPSDDPEAGQATIQDILPLGDSTFWVVDRFEEASRIRRLDWDGSLLGTVSEEGPWPGQHVAPASLTLLRDGRVLMVDPPSDSRLTIFDGDGALDEVLPFEELRYWHPSGRAVEDDDGIIWVLSGGTTTMRGERLPLHFTRTRADGSVVDTVHLPALPEVDRRFVRVRTLSSTRSYQLPWEPGVAWAVGPSGRFVTARGDEYRIVRHGPIDGDRTRTEVIATRDVGAIRPSRRERRELRDSLLARARAGNDMAIVEVPELREVKAPLRGFRFARDGRLLVHVSLPSRREDGRWIEPNGWDVFERDGTFVGRIVLPHDVELVELAGDDVWAVHTDEEGVESVRRYGVSWPDEG